MVCGNSVTVSVLDCVVSAMENPESLQEVKEMQHVIEMYKQKLHQLQSQLVTSCMMERELSVDLEVLQKKYDKDHTAAALQMKALYDKYSLTVKEVSEVAELMEKAK
jgi:hypothetical protein